MMEEITKFGTPQPSEFMQIGLVLTQAVERCFYLSTHYTYSNSYTPSDSALIIDAMDLLYTGKIRFCIVSSDSDFTRLAIRLREAGMKVIGIGEQKTPKPFISACDRFIFIEVLDGAIKKKAPKQNSDTKKVRKQL
jgi:hypothetical protein